MNNPHMYVRVLGGLLNCHAFFTVMHNYVTQERHTHIAPPTIASAGIVANQGCMHATQQAVATQVVWRQRTQTFSRHIM